MIVSLMIFSMSSSDKSVLEVISPNTIQKSVVTQVSHATWEFLSPAMYASNIASDMMSATLSGCPCVTDSDVKVLYTSLMVSCPFLPVGHVGLLLISQ